MSEDPNALKEEIAFLKQQLEVVADGITEQQYLQQAKKVRELSVRLDSEKARVAKLQQTVIKHERLNAERTEAERKGVLLPSASSNNNAVSSTELELKHVTAQFNELKSKLDRATSQNASLRALIEKHDRDMNRVKKILIAEIGDEMIVEKILSSSNDTETSSSPPVVTSAAATTTTASDYRGRAQQISLLQSKVKELTRKLHEYQALNDGTSNNNNNDTSSVISGYHAPSVITTVSASGVSTTVKDFDATHRSAIAQQESKKSVEIRQLHQQIEESKEATSKEKQRADALASRVHVLEKQTQQLRSSIQQVVQKTENDNKLIDAYKQELENQRGEIRQLSTLLQQHQYSNGGASSSSSSPAPALQAGSQSVAGIASQYPNSKQNQDAHQRSQKDIQRIASLETEVSILQRQVALSTNGDDAGHDNDDQRKHSNGNYNEIVESQRKMILNLEQKLQNAEAKLTTAKQSSSGVKGSGSTTAGPSPSFEQMQNLRDENASLKERMNAVTAMVEREVELKKAQLQAKYDQMMKEYHQSTQPQPKSNPLMGMVSSQRGSAIVSTSTNTSSSNNTTTSTGQHLAAPAKKTLRAVRSDDGDQKPGNPPPPPPSTPPPAQQNPRTNVSNRDQQQQQQQEQKKKNQINNQSSRRNQTSDDDDDADDRGDEPPRYNDDDDDGYDQGDREIPGAISSRSIPIAMSSTATTASAKNNSSNNNNNRGAAQQQHATPLSLSGFL